MRRDDLTLKALILSVDYPTQAARAIDYMTFDWAKPQFIAHPRAPKFQP